MTSRRDERLARLARARLYLIVTLPAPRWEASLEAALATGTIGLVQLRPTGAGDADVRPWAAHVREACRRYGALFLLNDRPALAVEVDADGAHGGQDDLPAAKARALLGPDRLLGLSTHDAGEIERARGLPIDYLGLGPCFASGSKTLLRPPGGAALVARCAPGAAPRPLYPIGGITPENAQALVLAGARRLAVGAGILGADDPAAAARALAALLPRDLP